VEKSEQWEKVKELFAAALERSSSQRTAFLRDACGENESLRGEVESLLSAHAMTDGLSEYPWVSPSEDLPRDLKFVGPYRLKQKLGEGGMGQVWLAEQTSPLQRQVALKLIKTGLYDDSVLLRFQSERQSLAIMDHPSIAKVFDAGATLDGQPYFVMEYVPGLPITDYCDQKHLKINERLELFIETCEGVQHAHQKAIIHRDLKPANILVQEVDATPVPRIIDFGLAKAATHTTGEVLLTQVGGFMGTPGYMSPEQTDLNAQDVDTRTDVYSLGAILYVLLTGSLPFDNKHGKKQPVYELLRRTREEDPPRPSTRIGLDQGSSTATAELRGTAPKQLVSLLRGDLDWIAMKALEKDRARRYGTPSELAADIRRYLRNEPITAHPPSTGYRLRKYVRRHRVGVGAAGIIATLLLAFVVVQVTQLRRITRERDRADRIADFMTGMFRASDPNIRLGGAITAEELLDKAAKEIDPGLAKDPELQVSLLHVIGRAYMYQGLFARAQSVFERGIKISTAAGQQNSRETMNTMHDLAWSLLQQGKLADAENLERKLLDEQQRVLGEDNADTLATKSELGFTLAGEGNTSEGVRLNAEVLEKQKRVLGPEAHYTLVTMDNLAIMLAENHQLAEAVKLEDEALAIHLKVDGLGNLATIDSMINLGEFQRDLGRDEDAKKSFYRALDLEEHTLRPDQPETAVTKYDLATILARNGQLDDAFSFLGQVVDHGLPPRIALDMPNDPLLNPLHGDSRFTTLVARAKQRASAAQNPN
jgi:serine/threonine protein kinase/tetratricopeptide (TPR) repeat protein